MDTYTLKRHIGEDGILRVELPLGVTETDVEVVVVVQAVPANNLNKKLELSTRANEAWTEEEEKQLLRLYHSGMRIYAIAKQHQRSRNAIRSRLRKLGIEIKES